MSWGNYRIKGTRSKYNAEKCWSSDGQRFDSKHECARYEELRILARLGEVKDLRRQVWYQLIPRQKVGDIEEESCSYIADFVYTNQYGETVVEDAKGYRGGEAYSLFVIKRKLMLQRYGIHIKEV